MKKWIALFLSLLMTLSLVACSKQSKRDKSDKTKSLTWQEQYDLGVRYLSEGNYEEARLAFEAAIEIDPKQADAYIGAAEAYIALGQPDKAQAILKEGLANATDIDKIQPVLDEIFNPNDFDESGTCGENVQWGFKEETGELTITGTGAMENYVLEPVEGVSALISSAPWSRWDVTSVKLHGVTAIGDNAFYQCDDLREVMIPDSVTSIGSGAFTSCYNLTTVTIPDSVTEIGTAAFRSCIGLTEITIPDSVTTIETNAFYWCTGLTEVTIPDSVTTIGYYAFSFCADLTEITIPDSVTTIEYYAFDLCNNLTDVYYGGTEEQWNNISIETGNDILTDAAIHFNR